MSRRGPESGRPVAIDGKTAARFWSKVRVSPSGVCWEWLGAKKRGRALFSIRHDSYPAARVAMALAGVPFAPEQLVCHTCDNPSCVNPEHLYAGSSSSNMRDAVRRGRLPRPGGTRHPNATLTEAQVRDIRARFQMGVKRNHLAREFGVSFDTINRVVRGESYRSVRPC